MKVSTNSQNSDCLCVMRNFAFIFLTAFISISCASLTSRADYPSAWWQPINDPQKPAWEILPQDAKPGEVILSKRTELGIFSNFAATSFEFRGNRYASVEGFWQMMKYPENASDPRAKISGWEFSRDEVAKMTAFDAKHAGDLGSTQMKKLKIDWVSFDGTHFSYRSAHSGEHYRLIIAAMCEKLKQNPQVRDLLMKTGDLILKPDHAQDPSDPPEWRYFEIWMRMREKLKKNSTNFCEV